jgi:Selenocysteine lyase
MIYFDNAATSRFKPRSVIRAFLKDIGHSANGGRSGHADAVNTAIGVSNAREIIRKLVNAENVVFTKNCTEALNLAIFGIVQDGGHVVTTVNEHNSVLRPLYFLAKEKRITLTVVNPDAFGIINPYHVARLINRDTCLVAVSAASNVTGAVLDVAAVGKACKERNVPLLIDGAQAVPHINMDMAELGINYLACPGHKGLHGFQGTGFLAICGEKIPRPLL